MKHMPGMTKGQREKHSMNNNREKDNKNKKLFSTSNIWSIVNYDKFGYLCSIYSNNDIGNKEVPTNEVVLKIDIRKNRGYVCKKSAFQGLVVKHAI